MPTGVIKGLTQARMVGSGPDNGGQTEYTIASGYATALGLGDPVKIHTDGTLVKATNGADAIGVFNGVRYIDAEGTPQFKKMWTASTVATDIKVLVAGVQPNTTYTAKAEGPIPLVQVGDIFALNLDAPDTNTGRSTVTVKTNTELVGDVDLDGETDIGANIAGVADADAFSIKTSQAATATTITIADGDGIVELLADLNAVDNISASLETGTGFLVIEATDGYDIVTAEVTNTPFVALMGVAAGTFSEVVAANAGLVKVIKVTDRTEKALEVVLVNHSLRDDG